MRAGYSIIRHICKGHSIIPHTPVVWQDYRLRADEGGARDEPLADWTAEAMASTDGMRALLRDYRQGTLPPEP